ncbi:hypothetical protein D9M72_441290 [compost metagenome]
MAVHVLGGQRHRPGRRGRAGGMAAVPHPDAARQHSARVQGAARRARGVAAGRQRAGVGRAVLRADLYRAAAARSDRRVRTRRHRRAAALRRGADRRQHLGRQAGGPQSGNLAAPHLRRPAAGLPGAEPGHPLARAHAAHDLRLGRAGLCRGAAAADADRGPGGRGAQPCVHPEPGRVQPGQRRRRLAGQPGAGPGPAADGPALDVGRHHSRRAVADTVGNTLLRPPRRGYTRGTSRRADALAF